MTATIRLRDLLARLQVSQAAYYKLRARGGWPFEEVLPRIGSPRFRLTDIERYERGEWQQPHLVARGRRAR